MCGRICWSQWIIYWLVLIAGLLLAATAYPGRREEEPWKDTEWRKGIWYKGQHNMEHEHVEYRDCARSISVLSIKSHTSLLFLRHGMNFDQRGQLTQGLQCHWDSAVYLKWSNTYWQWGRYPWGTVPQRKLGHRFSEIHNLKWTKIYIKISCVSA